MSSSQEQRDTHSSWTKRCVQSAESAGDELIRQGLTDITDSTGPLLFPVHSGHDALFVTFRFFKLTIWFYFVDDFTSTFFVWFCLDWKREPSEETHTLTHISVYKPKCQTLEKPFYIAKWRYCSYRFCIICFLSFLSFFFLTEKIAKWHNTNVLFECSIVTAQFRQSLKECSIKRFNHLRNIFKRIIFKMSYNLRDVIEMSRSAGTGAGLNGPAHVKHCKALQPPLHLSGALRWEH